MEHATTHRSPIRAEACWLPAIVAVVLIAIFVAMAVRTFDWDVAALLRTGDLEEASLEYVNARLGEVPTEPTAGHDGKHFFVLANDPLLLDPASHATNLARPTYRAQRILFPLLASPFGLLGQRGIVWGLLVVNLLAVGVGTWATARLATIFGGSAWLGMAFALNPGTIMEVLIDGSGVLAWALAMVSLVAVARHRSWLAVAAITGAVMSRETMILVALGVAVYLWRRGRPLALRYLLFPVSTAALWAVYVRIRMGVDLLTVESREIGLPFAGIAEAWQRWDFPGKDMLLGVSVVLLVVVCGYQAVSRPSLITWSTAAVALMIPFLTHHVWLGYYDISRAAMPLFTTAVLAMFLRHTVRNEPVEHR